jgi:hypothetical protein
MSIYSLTCPDVGCYTNYQCDPEFLNKVIAVAYVKKTAGFTIFNQSASQLRVDFLQLLADGDAYIVFNTSGEKPRPDTQTTAGRGMQTTKALAKTHTLNYSDMQGVVKENIEWYNNILSASQNYDFYYFTPGRVWDASGNYVTIIGDPVIGADLNTYQTAEVSVTWVSKMNPLPYAMDTDSFLEGLYYVISATSTWASFNWVTNDCSNFSPDLTATPNVSGITLGTQLWAFGSGVTPIVGEPGSFSIDNWVDYTGTPSGDTPTITIDANTGAVNVIPGGVVESNGSGSFSVIVKSQSGCVIGSQEINLVVAGCTG